MKHYNEDFLAFRVEHNTADPADVSIDTVRTLLEANDPDQDLENALRYLYCGILDSVQVGGGAAAIVTLAVPGKFPCAHCGSRLVEDKKGDRVCRTRGCFYYVPVSPAFDEALAAFLEAGHALCEAWDEDSVGCYPAYLPSFDEFLHDVANMTEPRSDDYYVRARTAFTKARMELEGRS